MADLSLDFQFKSSINTVWKALTASDTLAKWIMENDFKPIVDINVNSEMSSGI